METSEGEKGEFEPSSRTKLAEEKLKLAQAKLIEAKEAKTKRDAADQGTAFDPMDLKESEANKISPPNDLATVAAVAAAGVATIGFDTMVMDGSLGMLGLAVGATALAANANNETAVGRGILAVGDMATGVLDATIGNEKKKEEEAAAAKAADELETPEVTWSQVTAAAKAADAAATTKAQTVQEVQKAETDEPVTARVEAAITTAADTTQPWPQRRCPM